MEEIKEDIECKICTMEMTIDDSYRLKCGHKFHIICLKEWLNSIKSNSYSGLETRTCPYCRSKLKNEEELEIYKKSKGSMSIEKIESGEIKVKVVYEYAITYSFPSMGPIKSYGYLSDLKDHKCCAYTRRGERCKYMGNISNEEVKSGLWYYCKKHIEYSKYKLVTA